MKKLLCVLMALMLLGCMAQAEEVDYTGTWVLTGAETYGMRIATQAIGVAMTLVLREDGTAGVTSEAGGSSQSAEASWRVEDGVLALVDEDGVERKILYEDGMLLVDMSDGYMIFTREGAAPAVKMLEAPIPAANVTVESLEGTWILTRLTAMGTEVTPDVMGVKEGFTLKNGVGVYAITDDAGEMTPISITYTVTEVEGVGTQIDMAGVATPIMTLYITEDGVMFSDRSGVTRFYERLVTEDEAAG